MELIHQLFNVPFRHVDLVSLAIFKGTLLTIDVLPIISFRMCSSFKLHRPIVSDSQMNYVLETAFMQSGDDFNNIVVYNRNFQGGQPDL